MVAHRKTLKNPIPMRTATKLRLETRIPLALDIMQAMNGRKVLVDHVQAIQNPLMRAVKNTTDKYNRPSQPNPALLQRIIRRRGSRTAPLESW